MDEPGGTGVGRVQVTLSDKELFDTFFSNLAEPVSDYSFANIFPWCASLHLSWAHIDRHLCVFANSTGDLTMLMPPLPAADASDADAKTCLRTCFDIMDGFNDRRSDRSRSRIEYVSDEMLSRLEAAGPTTRAAALFSGDYVYDMRKMIDLDGKALKSKRHSRSKFIRDFPNHRVENFDESHQSACTDLLNLWQRHGDEAHIGEVNEEQVGSDVLRRRDTHACQIALTHFRALNLTGMVLYVGDRLVGFTLGEKLGRDQASILIEKTHPDFPGSAQFIFSEFCRLHWAHLSECNAGDDWGIPSLRFTKQTYRPSRMIGKHTLTLNRPVMVPIVHPEVPLVLETAAVGSSDAQPEALVLRRATVADRDALTALEHACFTGTNESFNKRQIRYLLTSPTAIVTVAQQGQQIIGWSVGLLRQHRKTRSGRVYAVAVSPEHQGKGLGRNLVQTTIDLLRQHGSQRIYLEVRSDNERAINLYKHVGFAKHRFLPAYYGPDRHAIRMVLPMERPSLTPPATTPALEALEAPLFASVM
jgi:ribosomal protein S18 acetylase RimI-like enzyme